MQSRLKIPSPQHSHRADSFLLSILTSGYLLRFQEHLQCSPVSLHIKIRYEVLVLEPIPVSYEALAVKPVSLFHSLSTASIEGKPCLSSDSNYIAKQLEKVLHLPWQQQYH